MDRLNSFSSSSPPHTNEGLAEFETPNMDRWMAVFNEYLKTSYPSIESNPQILTAVDDLRVAVYENISLCMEKSEEFEFVDKFINTIRHLVVEVVKSSNRDQLAFSAIKFLCRVSTSCWKHVLFQGGVSIEYICEHIVVPYSRLSRHDEDLFERDYIEFIRRDMEGKGNDLYRRRGFEVELLKGIATSYSSDVTESIVLRLKDLLTKYNENYASDFRDMECAMYLYFSLTKNAPNLLVYHKNYAVLFKELIVSELCTMDGHPLLKAGALKFLTVFPSMLEPLVAQLLPHLVQFLRSQSNVVRSYAANVIKKVLLVKNEQGQPMYNGAPIVVQLFQALTISESEEDQYIMECIMHAFEGAEMPYGFERWISYLTPIVQTVCRSPKKTIFNNYLFESVAILVRRAPEFENRLLPILDTIVQSGETVFSPYAFQLFAVLAELSREPMSPSFIRAFEYVVSPDKWKSDSNFPAYVQVLQAILPKICHPANPNQNQNQKSMLDKVVDICKHLLQSPSTDEQGIYVMNTD